MIYEDSVMEPLTWKESMEVGGTQVRSDYIRRTLRICVCGARMK